MHYSGRTSTSVLGAISFAHALNDTMQSLLLASYPLFKSDLHLNFTQIGLVTLVYQSTASLLQPLVGAYTDRHPKPFSLVVGMGLLLMGLLLLAHAASLDWLLLAAALVGSGSSIFHPEASRVARMASGGRHGLAQSIFQVGGNMGSSLGPLFAVWIVLPHGQGSLAWFSLIALLGMLLLAWVGVWYRQQYRRSGQSVPLEQKHPFSVRTIRTTMAVLIVLMFSKFFYLASISSYLIFYLMQRYGVAESAAQYHLFYFLAAVAVGTVMGGPMGDRMGRKPVIWVSILGITPFTLMLPYVGLGTSVLLTLIIGFLLASAFPAMLVYAQELLPGRTGSVAGLFFGLAFGLGGLGAAILGHWADRLGIINVYKFCSWLPLLGLFALFLPDLKVSRITVSQHTR